MRKHSATCLMLLLAAALGGCMPSQALPAGEIEKYWHLQADSWDDARPKDLTFGGRQFPSRWTFRHEESLIWSTVSMVRAVDKLEVGADDFDVGVSPTHADMLRLILADVRGTLTELRKVADPEHAPRTPRKWAQAVADALVSAEKVARLAAAETSGTQHEQRGDPLGWTAGPMIQMFAGYMDERTGGSLLSGMEEQARLRSVLAQIVLRLGFAAAGRQDPPALRQRVVDMMRQAEKPEQLGESLTALLADEFVTAHPAEAGNRLPSILHSAFTVAVGMLRVSEDFLRQWDNMESMAFELRELDGEPVVSAIVKVKPARELRLLALVPFQPVLAFRGGVRITVLPKDLTQETVVVFEPLEGGRAELRFEGIVYALARLFAFPLADAALREVRVASEGGPAGDVTSVTILMTALHDSKDPARILVFQDVRKDRIERTAFAVGKVRIRSEQTFNYLTPQRRYTYQRVRTAGE